MISLTSVAFGVPDAPKDMEGPEIEKVGSRLSLY